MSATDSGCARDERGLAEAAGRELNAGQREWVYQHVRDCMACRVQFGGWVRQRRALRGLAREAGARARVPAADPAFFERLRREIDAAVERDSVRAGSERAVPVGGWRRRLRTAAAAAALVVAGAGLAWSGLVAGDPLQGSGLFDRQGITPFGPMPDHGGLDRLGSGLQAQHRLQVLFEQGDGPPAPQLMGLQLEQPAPVRVTPVSAGGSEAVPPATRSGRWRR